MPNKAIETLKLAGMEVKPGAMLPFVNVLHPGQMFRWDGPTELGGAQIEEAKVQLQQNGFEVEFVDLHEQVLHVVERPRG